MVGIRIPIAATYKRRRAVRAYLDNKGYTGTRLTDNSIVKLATGVAHLMSLKRELTPVLLDGGKCDPTVGEQNYLDDCMFEDRVAAVTPVLAPYLGERIDNEGVRYLTACIAGNWNRFRDGLIYSKWNTTAPVKAAIRVVDARRVQTPSKSSGKRFQVTADVFLGAASGMLPCVIYAGGFVQALIRQVGGSSKVPYPGEDISGLYFAAEVYMDKNNKPTYRNIHVTGGMEDKNKKLLRLRRKACTGPLHKVMPTCQPCIVGRDKCALARLSTSLSHMGECDTGHTGVMYSTKSTVCFPCLRLGRTEWVSKGQ